MIFYAFGEYFSKRYANTSLKHFGFLAVFLWSFNSFCFLPAISKFNSLSILGTIWNLLYVFITLFIGLVIFKEPITTIQTIGLVLGVIAIILLTI